MSENLVTHAKLSLCSEVINAYTANCTQRSRTTFGNHLPEIIQLTCELRSSKQGLEHKLLPEIIARWKILKAEQFAKNMAYGHLFNPLATIPIGEIIHSRLLGDLLDPKGSHGQGQLFLDAFLESISVPNPTDGDWMISIEDGRVDICIWRLSPASVVIIENKSNWAVDQQHQLYRYWYENIQKIHPTLDYSQPEVKQSFQLLYLPPTAGKQPDQHSLQRPEYLDYTELPKTLREVGVTVKILPYRDHIAAWLNVCEQLIPPTNTRLRAHLQFYKELWN